MRPIGSARWFAHFPTLHAIARSYSEGCWRAWRNGEVGMELSYLIRYGLWHQVGRFASDSPDLERGQTVVVRSHRGIELGEVLIKVEVTPENASPPSPAETARVLRAATRDDLDRARRLELERPRRFDLCQRIIRDRERGAGAHRRRALARRPTHTCSITSVPTDSTSLDSCATLRSTCNIDGLLEPVVAMISPTTQETLERRSRSELRTLRVGWRRLWVGSGCSATLRLRPRWLFRLRDQTSPRREAFPPHSLILATPHEQTFLIIFRTCLDRVFLPSRTRPLQSIA